MLTALSPGGMQLVFSSGTTGVPVKLNPALPGFVGNSTHRRHGWCDGIAITASNAEKFSNWS